MAEYRNQPVKFFWVSIERPEEVSDNALKRYARERKVSFPVLRDTAKMVFLQFSPRVRLPMIVMLGKNGRVDVPVQFGMRTPAEAYKADIRTRLNKLLAQPTQAEYSTRQCGDDSLTAYTGDTAPFSFLSSNKTGVGKQQAGLTMKQKIGWAERSPHCRVEH